MTLTGKEPKEEKTICPFCLIELKDQIDWQKFFLIISGYDDIMLNDLLLLTDKANEIIKKEIERRTGIKSYESQQQQQPITTIEGQQQLPPGAKQLVMNTILKKWVDKNCPFCKTQFWLVTEQIYQLMPWRKGAGIIIGGGSVQPVVSVICRNCGYTPFFNAMITGVVKPEPKPST